MIVTGVVSPLVLKPAPVTVADEIVSEAVPPFVIFTGVVFVLPSVTLPKLTEVGFAEISGCVPVPLREIVSGEPGALLVIETLPLPLPDEVGANSAVKVVFAPALIVTGTVKPVMLKPVPEALAAEIVTLAVPEFVKVITSVALLPTNTLPKLYVDGFAVSEA